MKLRKILVLILAAIAIVAVAICLSSCNPSGGVNHQYQHDYGDWVDEVNTCTEHTRKRVCRICGAEEVRYVTPDGHAFGAWEVDIDTCTELTWKRVCKFCDEEEIERATPVGHSYVWEDLVYTCTEHTQKRTCSRCDEEIIVSLEPTKPHSYSDWEYVTDSCLERDQTRYCSECKNSETRTVDARGHILSSDLWEDVVYTCTEHTQRQACSRCNEILTRQARLKEHSFGNWEYITPDCGETNQRRSCADCTAYEDRTVEAKAHTYGELEEISNTCTEHKQKITCSNCGDVQFLNLRPHGHIYSGGMCEYCNTLFYDGDISVLDKYNGTYGYEYLLSTNEAQAELYERIDEQVRAFHLNADIDAELNSSGKYVVAKINYSDLGLETDAAIAVWKTYMDDNPLYYWLSGSLLYSEESLRLIAVEDYAHGSTRAQTNEFIYNKIAEFSSKTLVGDNAYRLALAFHDAIIEAIDYAYDGSGNAESADWAHSVIGVFTGRGGVCESYAKTFQLLLNYNGVENIFVTGQGRNEAHAWNMVKLDDGNWYWCDLTWDDTPNWEWGISYYYFLVNDTENVSWRDAGYSPSTQLNFLNSHTYSTPEGETTDFLYPLPARAAQRYAENNGVKVRSTFTVGNMTYAVTGYNTVQLTSSKATGAVTIPERVIYNGVTYTVISIGHEENGLFNSGSVLDRGTTSLYIPKTVKFVWEHAAGASNNGYITVDGANEMFCSVDGVMFTKSMKVLVQYPAAREGEEYHIPDECVYVVHYAFTYKSTCLSELYLGANLLSFNIVGWGRNYEDSTNFLLGGEADTVKYLSGQGRIIAHEDSPYYFSDDKALYGSGGKSLVAVFDFETVTEFEIPTSVTYVYDRVFDDCRNLTAITVEEGNTAFAALGGILYSADYSKMIAVPNGLSGSVTLSDSVESIGEYKNFETCNSFYNRKIESVTFGTSVTTIGRSAFAHSSIKSIFYGGTVEEWLAIEKGNNWCYASDFTIICSDGTLDKDGNLI